MEERRQNGGRRCQIVQEFVKTISDDTERLVCYLYMHNYTDAEVRKELHLNRPRLEAIKLKLAMDMKKVGIRNGGSEQLAVRARA
mgnify:CR=1 FL=1